MIACWLFEFPVSMGVAKLCEIPHSAVNQNLSEVVNYSRTYRWVTANSQLPRYELSELRKAEQWIMPPIVQRKGPSCEERERKRSGREDAFEERGSQSLELDDRASSNGGYDDTHGALVHLQTNAFVRDHELEGHGLARLCHTSDLRIFVNTNTTCLYVDNHIQHIRTTVSPETVQE